MYQVTVEHSGTKVERIQNITGSTQRKSLCHSFINSGLKFTDSSYSVVRMVVCTMNVYGGRAYFHQSVSISSQSTVVHEDIVQNLKAPQGTVECFSPFIPFFFILWTMIHVRKILCLLMKY